ncbi:MAG: zf-HC2 domain-containing protein [Acidimicrobiales bacterium]
MRCTRFREAISARIDGEDPGLPPGEIDAHLTGCPDCRSWARAATSPALSALASHGDPVALAPALLAQLVPPAPAPEPARPGLISTVEWRVVLAVIGLAQVALAWPGVFLDGGHASIHLAHELTGWDMGLAAGFLVVAWRPARAWGMLPLVVVLVAAIVVTSGVDLASGHALLGREVVHALALAGLGCLWALARRAPRPSVVVRVA